MDQPKGFAIQGKERKVCCLKKAIYGLKQAGRQWYIHLNDTLEGLGFQKLISGDALIFIKRHNGGDPLIALVYIDDITLFGILEAIQDLKHAIAMRYKVTDLGEIKQFLDLHIGGYSESSDICTCRLFCLYFIVHVDICCMHDSL